MNDVISNVPINEIICKICHSLIKWEKPSCVSMRAVYLKCKTLEIFFVLLVLFIPFYHLSILLLHIERPYKVG